MHKQAQGDFVIAILLLSTLVILCLYLAIYIHPHGDDYCHARLWKTGADWYEYSSSYWNILSGRWATALTRYAYYDVVGLSADRYWIVTVTALCSILGGYILAAVLSYGHSNVAFIWAILCTVIFIALASAIDALLFWMTGLTDYTLGYLFVPLALWLAATVLFGEHRPRWWCMSLAGICLFWSCGFSELFLMPVACFLLGSMFISRYKLRVAILGLFALAGTLMNVLAPGNAQRQMLIALDIDLSEIVFGTLFYGLRGLLLPVLALAILSSFPFIARPVKQLVFLTQQHVDHKLIVLVAVLAMLYPFAIEFALFWNLGAPGPGRAHNISLFTLIVSWPFILAALGQRLPSLSFRLPKSVKAAVQLLAIGLLVAVNPLQLVRDIVNGTSDRYHHAVAHAEQALRHAENQRKDVVLPTTDLVTTDKNHWLNKCVAEYFGVNTVRGTADQVKSP